MTRTTTKMSSSPRKRGARSHRRGAERTSRRSHRAVAVSVSRPRPNGPVPTVERAIEMPVRTNSIERFWSLVQKDGPGGCWLWKGSTVVGGYGRISFRGKLTLAHRIAYELLVGLIPEGKDLLHRCDNPPCVNPAHLYPGDRKQNSADCVLRRRNHCVRRTHCAKDHPYDEANTINYPQKGKAEWRICRTCFNAKQRRIHARRRARLRTAL